MKECKGLGKYKYTIKHPVFGPSSACAQSQNPRRSAATPVVLLNRRRPNPTQIQALSRYICIYQVPKLPSIAFILAVTVIICSGCAPANVPSTTTGASRPASLQPGEDEKKLWQSARELEQQIDSNGFRYKDDQLDAYLDSVLQRLLPAENPYPAKPRVKVVRSPALNAFALPNGAIYLHTGMLAKMEDEAQLAALLGHELAHFTNRHALQEARKAQERSPLGRAVEATLSKVAAVLGGDEGGQEMKELIGDIRDLWVQTSLKGYSRELEMEADEEGLKAYAAAGYNLAEATKVFELLKQDIDETKGREPFFFSTHPRLQERIDNYRGLVAELSAQMVAKVAAGQSMPGNQDIYHRRTARLLLDNAVMDVRGGRIKSAEATVARYLLRERQDPRGFFLRGEIHRRTGRLDSAIDSYRQAAGLDPAYADPHRELGFVYLKLDRGQEAYKEFEEYIRLQPDALDALEIRQHIAR